MVLDAGGGTVDWTVHECILRGEIKGEQDTMGGNQAVQRGTESSEASEQTVLSEAVHAVGEMLGSTLLDRAFMVHLQDEVGAKVGQHSMDIVKTTPFIILGHSLIAIILWYECSHFVLSIYRCAGNGCKTTHRRSC
jgi:hypothetical protein